MKTNLVTVPMATAKKPIVKQKKESLIAPANNSSKILDVIKPIEAWHHVADDEKEMLRSTVIMQDLIIKIGSGMLDPEKIDLRIREQLAEYLLRKKENNENTLC